MADQPLGGAVDVMRWVDCLEQADMPQRAIGRVAVKHWSGLPLGVATGPCCISGEDLATLRSAAPPAGGV